MLRWGIIGTGNIAHTFARAIQASKSNELVAVGSRSMDTARKFAEEFNVQYSFGSYESLLAFDGIDIVYISTPHPYHYELALASAKANKHMLIEKPMAINEIQVKTILETAKEHNTFVMEAYMYRCHPQTLKLVDLIQSGVIGQVKFIRAHFSFDGRPLGPTSRLWRNELGGGAIMDIGGYPLSFARLIAKVANNNNNKKNYSRLVKKIKATGYIQPDTQVDEWSNASIEFEGNITAQLFTGIFADTDSSVEVLGSEGMLKVVNLWRPDLPQLGPVQIEYTEYGKEMKIIPVELEETNLFAYEADAVADAIAQGQLECKYMNWQDSLDQANAMDAWRKEIGLKYKEDN
ncbi:uncharacterized protein BX663DRAFT_535550 [Cokeromyces recurvatus]|uniref:uncharacterized protein n=1 Tax=Cokeromyces recurvatus TaxID=90255 RepID=UPI00221E93F8|nr:uncharacterized protein BX663DRAFT_535550 [Cokeromyces recurvatus]KAI7904647.1 hypothetical protein BX663DRAFT_535550 [Cokeromyces recurvatus]